MSDNIYQLNGGTLRRPGNFQGGGNGGDMDNVIKRVELLEKNTHQIRVDVATLSERSKNFATKEDVQLIRTDMQKELVRQTKWLATTMIAVASVGLAVAKYLFG